MAFPLDQGRSTKFARRLFTPLPGRYDLLAELLSFGQNAAWRREMVGKAVRENPDLLLDVATGTGGVARQIVRRSSASVVALDVTSAMLHCASQRNTSEGVSDRISLVQASAESLPFPDATFQAVTFTYLLRYVPDPASTILELARVLRPAGVMASLEFAVPPSQTWRRAWWLYTRGVLPLAGLATGGPEWYRVGRFLGPSISQHYSRYSIDWTVAAWRAAGLKGVRLKRMSLGGGLVMWGTKDG
jgi:demethylmenaquinone methyltransferase/2-methoxy-6-polyprenyl-1,4-benzoquinol methylase